MSSLFAAIPYLLAIGTIILGAFEIMKDWHDYRDSRLKMAVASVFIIVAILSLVGLYHDSQEKTTSKIKADGDMRVLQSKADAAEQAQKDNTRLFTDKFTQMSAQVGDLKAEVKTEALQKKLTAVQAELLNTQKAMAPGPKAELALTFIPFFTPALKPAILTKEVTVARGSDGAVHVELGVVNTTTVDALDTVVDVEICDGCKFAKEPRGLDKVPDRETMRILKISDIHALEAYEPVDLDIIPPPGFSQMGIGFEYRCHTCVVYRSLIPETSGIIHIE
jgi:hypothetical protein